MKFVDMPGEFLPLEVGDGLLLDILESGDAALFIPPDNLENSKRS